MSGHLPLSAGPFVPGIVDVMLDYKKEAPFFRMYYPTAEKFDMQRQSSKWLNWLPDETYLDGISKVLMLYKILLKIAFWWSVDGTKIPAVYGAKPKTDSQMKCVVMSHGLGGCRFLYSNICCELASRGFLVVALEHRDHSACSTFYYSSKSHAEADRRSLLEFRHISFGKDHYSRRNEQLKTKSAECSQVLDFLKNVHSGIVPHNILDDTPFHKKENKIDFQLDQLIGKLDVENVVMMGHSFGAATALYTLSTRPDFKLGVLLDPWMFPLKNEELVGKISQPMLFINTQTFHIAANVEAMSKLLETDTSNMFTIKHTTHENQTDSVLLIGYWLNWFMRKLDPLLALKINNSLILRFLRNHLAIQVDISDCLDLLEKEKDNIEVGLTKPWA